MNCYSSTIIVIDNLLLREILQRYIELGVFGDLYDKLEFVIGDWTQAECVFDPDRGELVFDDRWSLTPAVSWDSNMFNNELSRNLWIPRTLNQVLDTIVDYMDENVIYNTPDNGAIDEDLFMAMKKELKEREDEILHKYDRVRMEYISDYLGNEYEGRLEEESSFKFDRENGEEFHYLLKDTESEDMVREEKIVNGKWIIEH